MGTDGQRRADPGIQLCQQARIGPRLAGTRNARRRPGRAEGFVGDLELAAQRVTCVDGAQGHE
jgi:hypothetical protein